MLKFKDQKVTLYSILNVHILVDNFTLELGFGNTVQFLNRNGLQDIAQQIKGTK